MTRLAFLLVLLVAASAAAAPPRYEAARADIVREGRAVAELVRAGDGDAIFARFGPELAAAVPKSEVEQVPSQSFSKASLGARTAESALPMAPTRRFYLAEHRWGSNTLALTVVFDAAGAIAGIDLSPRRTLPPDPRAGYRLKARLSLPFRGERWVFWGGPTERQNYHVVAPDQRHAYDFVAWQSGATHRGAGTRNADYRAWGRPVIAPPTASSLLRGTACATTARRSRSRTAPIRPATTSSSTSAAASSPCWRTCSAEVSE